MEQRKICRRCLASEMPDAAYFQTMYEYITNLDDEIKTPQPQYQERLSLCKKCDSLLNGMCRVCGCFVEMRAAIARNGCPAIHPRW